MTNLDQQIRAQLGQYAWDDLTGVIRAVLDLPSMSEADGESADSYNRALADVHRKIADELGIQAPKGGC